MPNAALADPLLAFLAAIVDDLEDTRKANENRLRQLTRTETDSDGKERGFGLDDSDPAVAQLAALVDALTKLEHQAVLNLQRRLRKHPLAAWCKATKGIGEKQAARLLAVIGDPGWHVPEDRPRGLRELWAYCGLHNLPAAHLSVDSQGEGGGGDQISAGGDLDQASPESQTLPVFIAARRAKGQRANWSTAAKSRAYLIAEAMLKAGNREMYDARRAATADKLHAAPCPQCGSKGKPALPGTHWRLGHQHADALRVVAKDAVLRPLWQQARDLHQDHRAAQGPLDRHRVSGGSDQPNETPLAGAA
jgi:hypothetical protein